MSFNLVGDISSQTIRMAWLFVGFLVFLTIIEGTDQTPPKLYECRDLYKHKNTDEEYLYTFSQGVTCESSIQLPVISSDGVNFTHVSNCVNYINCKQYTCLECPCPGDTTYNPVTGHCDDTRAACSCDHTQSTTIPTIVAASSAKASVPAKTTTVKIITAPPGSATSTPQPVDNGVIIIVVIVAVTVIILVLLIVGFVLWQRGVFTLRKKPQMGPSNNDGYLHTLPPQERHVYAEIDERMVPTDGPDRHAMSLPVYPNSPPTPPSCPPTRQLETVTHPSFQRAMITRASCPQHLYHTPTQQLTIAIPGRHAPPAYEVINHNRASSCDSSLTTCSECSHGSAMSSQIPLTYTHDNIDRRTLLSHANINNNQTHPQWNNVSKQVYI